MEISQIRKDELMVGDILLCNIPQRSFLDYLKNIMAVIKHYRATGHFSLEGATDLIHWVIGVFDDYHYCHASFWNGEKVVESRIKGGLRANDISTYSEDTVDVFRYRKGDERLGDPALPPAPLLQKAQELVARHWDYGFDSAYLLAILCVSRWHRAEWVDRIRDLLLRYAPHALEESINILFRDYRPQIDKLIEHLITMALEVVREYRNRDGYVCSQTVAVIFNEACDGNHPAGTYKLDKPSYSKPVSGLSRALLSSLGEKEISECKEMVRELGTHLKQRPEVSVQLMAETSLVSYEDHQVALQKDSFYTPRDLAESKNTVLSGRLVL